MLRHLHIENYALIDKLGIDFSDGLTTITGETGAGKSILLGALSLILGQRADHQVLSDKTRKCIIEGRFDIGQAGLESLFEDNHLDYDAVSIFRREITPQGKSRAFVNDTPVSLQLLKEMADKIIDIHSQHQNLLLGETSFQFDMVDAAAGLWQAVNNYRTAFAAWQQRRIELAGLEAQELRSRLDLDYYQFQFEELEKVQLDETAFRQWEEEIELIRHAADIQQNMKAAGFIISGHEHHAEGQLYSVLQQIKPLAKYSADYKQLADRIESLLIELRDINAEIESISAQVSHDPERANELEVKLDAINKLFLKHHVTSVEELVLIKSDYENKILNAQSLEEKIAQEQKAVETEKAELLLKAGSISVARKEAIPDIERQLLEMLRELGMPGATLTIDQQPDVQLSVNGTDKITILFSANPGAELREISRVASGGEISRFMLCIKNLLAKKKRLPSVIFDEIDTGISGEVGGKIGDIMLRMSEEMQVIAITHLPQIAARGQHHLLVFKTIEEGKTQTRIKVLDKNEKINQIARMLGGESPTTSMLKTAEELIINK